MSRGEKKLFYSGEKWGQMLFISFSQEQNGHRIQHIHEKVKIIQTLNVDLDLSKNQPRKVPSGVPPYTTTKFGDNPSKGLGGVGNQTNRQTFLKL